MKDTSYEIYGRGFGWSWRLRFQGDVIATGGHHYDTSKEARTSVDRTRGAVALLTGNADSFKTEDVTEPKWITREEPTIEGDLPEDRDNWIWELKTPNYALANSADRFSTEEEAQKALDVFLERSLEGLPIFLVGSEYEWKNDLRSINVGKPSITGILKELKRGFRHRNSLKRIENRISITGTRGKTSTTRFLDDIFNRRGYDTLTKITGNHPKIIHNGEVYPIERLGPRVTLYENVSIVREFSKELSNYDGDDIGIFENQGITEYTTGLINKQIIDPNIIVVTNVRQDHTDTLGQDRVDIARAFARSVSEGQHVISGEQNPVLHKYMKRIIEKRGGTIEKVTIPNRHQGMIASETAHAVNKVLDYLDEPTLPEVEIDSFLEGIQPEWTQLPNGRIFNAAESNDVESTEMVRQVLVPDEDKKIQPFVFLRGDRRGRTFSFSEYVDILYDKDRIDSAHVGGANTGAFSRKTEVPVTQHDTTEKDAETVLDELLEEDQPVILMGNTVHEFMRDIEEEIINRKTKARFYFTD